MRRISLRKLRPRKETTRTVLRWVFYSGMLLLMYAFLCNPLIRGWCPLMIIPLAVAVSMLEGDLAAGIFGAVCGLMMDMASGTLTGFYALLLIFACPVVSLLSRFWVKVNVVSHFVMNAVVTVTMAALDMLFLHWVWEREQSGISFVNVILPAYGGSILFAAPIYLLTSFVVKKLRPSEQSRLESSARNAEDAQDKEQE